MLYPPHCLRQSAGLSPPCTDALRSHSPTVEMSSLPKPFSVCEGPCESCAARRRGLSSALHQRLPSPLLAASAASATGLVSLKEHPRLCEGRRNLAAAAIGGRKITHPGKAILAGGFSGSFKLDWRFQSSSCSLCVAERTVYSNPSLSPLKLSTQNRVKKPHAKQDATAVASCSLIPVFIALCPSYKCKQ